MAGDRLKGIADVAAEVTIVDDQRRAPLIANSSRDPHDLGIGPPFEHGADRRCAHQRRQQRFKARRRFSGGAEHQLAIAVDFDYALMPAGLALHHLMDRQHVEILVG